MCLGLSGQRAEAQSPCAPGESRGPFLVVWCRPGISAISTGVGDHIAEPEHHHGNYPEIIDGETDEANQEGDRKDRHHDNVRCPALAEHRVNASSLR
jgi:hypothetical protein